MRTWGNDRRMLFCRCRLLMCCMTGEMMVFSDGGMRHCGCKSIFNRSALFRFDHKKLDFLTLPLLLISWHSL